MVASVLLKALNLLPLALRSPTLYPRLIRMAFAPGRTWARLRRRRYVCWVTLTDSGGRTQRFHGSYTEVTDDVDKWAAHLEPAPPKDAG